MRANFRNLHRKFHKLTLMLIRIATVNLPLSKDRVEVRLNLKTSALEINPQIGTLHVATDQQIGTDSAIEIWERSS